MEAQLGSRLSAALEDVVMPTGSVAEELWKEGRRDSSHEAMLADMLAVYRQNCDLREQVNKLLGLLEEKDKEIISLRSQGRNNSGSMESTSHEEEEELRDQYEQLQAANSNLWKRYNDMDTVAMELEEKCRVLEAKNLEMEERLAQIHRDRHYDEPCSEEDRPLPEPQLSRLPFFHGKVGRREAERILQPKQEGDFLVRNCDMSPSDYTLSVKHKDTVRHFLVRTVGHRLFLGANAYKGWIHLIEYHREKSLFATNYRRLTLNNAVNK